MHVVSRALLAAGAICLATFGAGAGALRVAPVTLDLAAPAATGSITLRNEGSQPIGVQIRVFRWSQDSNGADVLEPTIDVVASPPAAQIAAGGSYLVRVVRPQGAPPHGEASFRLLIDELPKPGSTRPGQVNLLVRQSIPVFFSAPDRSPPVVRWKVASGRGGLVIQASNSGEQRFKVSELALALSGGRTTTLEKGLAGYVLGKSTRTWVFPSVRNVPAGSTVMLNALNENNRISVQETVRPSP